MKPMEKLSWEVRARAAEKTSEVLKNKVQALMNGEQSAIQKRLERARLREEENRRKREVMEARAAEMAKYARGLEDEVADRTRDLKEILDNVTFGFLVINQELEIQEGYTRSCCELLDGDQLAKTSVLDALRVVGQNQRDHFALSVDEVFEDIMPEALTLHQMPQRFVVGDRTLRVEGRVIRNDDNSVRGLLLTISDITRLELAQDENAVNRSLIAILKERDAFTHFLADTKAQIHLAMEATEDEKFRRRVVHTIKGNSGSWGLRKIGTAIHEMENDSEITREHLEAISSLFTDFLDAHQDVLEMSWNEDRAEYFSISAERMSALEAMIDRQKLENTDFKRWTAEVYLKPARSLIGPIDGFVEKLADRLDKCVQFECDGLDTLVDATRMQPVVQTLTHLVRNALDHGIEPGDLRGDKDEVGQIRLAVSEDEEEWKLTISDDGQGIDIQTLTVRAIDKGAISEEAAQRMSEEELLRLVFVDGLSSAEQTTEISGRGIGMSAVLSKVDGAGGQIDVESEFGKGTTFTIRLPKPPALATPTPKPFEAAPLHH